MSLKRCKLSRKQQNQLLEHFVLEVTARSAADLLGLQPNTTALYYGKIRQLIVDHLAAIEHEVFAGSVELDQRRALRAAAENAFPGARLQGLFDIPADTATAAAGAITPEALAKNLNAMPVEFDRGGGNVSADSLDLVTQAADAIRAAPPGTRLLIVGPVVATADAGNDLFLSKQRAEALKVQLILNGVSPASIETRGWGQNADGTPVEGAAPPPGDAAMRFELL